MHTLNALSHSLTQCPPPPGPPACLPACTVLCVSLLPYRSRAAAARSPVVNNYSSTTIVAAPPVYSPFGFGGFGFGGFRIMPVIPIPFFGGLLQVCYRRGVVWGRG